MILVTLMINTWYWLCNFILFYFECCCSHVHILIKKDLRLFFWEVWYVWCLGKAQNSHKLNILRLISFLNTHSFMSMMHLNKKNEEQRCIQHNLSTMSVVLCRSNQTLLIHPSWYSSCWSTPAGMSCTLAATLTHTETLSPNWRESILSATHKTL